MNLGPLQELSHLSGLLTYKFNDDRGGRQAGSLVAECLPIIRMHKALGVISSTEMGRKEEGWEGGKGGQREDDSFWIGKILK